MKSKAIIPLAVGLAVGLFAIKYTMDTVKKAGGAPSETIPVVVAAMDVPALTEIKPEMLKVVKSPRTPLLPQDVISDPEKIRGRVALKSIPLGSPLLPSMLAVEGTQPGIVGRLGEGYRAVAVKIDESSGVAYLVRPNDWVDVLVVMDTTKHGRRETISRVILQNVQVGAVGQVLSDKQEAEGRGGGHAKSVTLLVKTEDVPKLHLAETKGRITLAMRGLDDQKLSKKGPEASESEVFGDPNAPAKPDSESDSSSTSMTGLFSAWMQAGAASSAASTQAKQLQSQLDNAVQPVTVTVVNNSASGKGKGDIEQVTFRDDKSMEVTDVTKGLRSGEPQIRRPQSAGIPSGRIVEPPSPAPDEEEREVEDSASGSSEVNE